MYEHVLQAITENVFDAVRQVLPNSPLLTLQSSVINSESEKKKNKKPKPESSSSIYLRSYQFSFSLLAVGLPCYQQLLNGSKIHVGNY